MSMLPFASRADMVEAMAKVDAPILYQDRRTFQGFWNEEYKAYGTLIEQEGLRKKK